MLKDDLYFVQNVIAENNSVKATIILNDNHSIFEGHFPSQPVLPGVCMMQMTREILEIVLEKKIQLLNASDIRFTVMIIPEKNMELIFAVEYKIENNTINISAKILKDDVVCFKMKAKFIDANTTSA